MNEGVDVRVLCGCRTVVAKGAGPAAAAICAFSFAPACISQKTGLAFGVCEDLAQAKRDLENRFTKNLVRASSPPLLRPAVPVCGWIEIQILSLLVRC